jgi:myo-inositol-1(or 4)-monophosphatase
MNEDFKEYVDAACIAARAAGQYLKSQFGRASQIRYKGEWDPVTPVDINSEKIILDLLGQQFPDHGFFSEESGTSDRSTPFCWIIDPLDGTRNFLHKHAHFAVSIALKYQKEIVVGVVYQPMTDEIYMAIQGQGAYLNKERLKVSEVDTLAKSLLTTGFGSSIEKRRQQQVFLSQFLEYSGGIRVQGSVALALCSVARGICDGYWEPSLPLWDIAAGMLLVSEAGGQITSLDGTPFHDQVGDLLASNGLLHQELVGCCGKVNR